jgi:mannan endo-1,4-beta-mannosidase
MPDFARVSGTTFLLDGRPAWFAGANNYYQMLHRSSGRAADADEVLDKMAARSLTLLRTWAFQDMCEFAPSCLLAAPARALSDGQRPVDFISEDTLRGLDATLAAADARSIRVILTFVNNWADYGGIDRWTLWRFGSPNHDAFYTDPIIRAWFKELIALLIGRVNTVNGRTYRDDPAIFAWELANEPRASASSAAALDAWIAEMSTHVKSLDPNHLVTTGTEDFYGPAYSARNTDSWMAACGTDFILNHRHPAIDFATCHVWPENWGWNPIGNRRSALDRALNYVNRRVRDAAETLAKPLLIEEFGLPRDNKGKGVNGGPTQVRDQFYAEVFYDFAQRSVAAHGPCGGTLFWILYDDPTAGYDDGNGVYLPHDATTDAIITAHARFMTQRSALV